MRVRKKPVIVEAHRWDGDWESMGKWATNVSDGNGTGIIYTRENGMECNLRVRTLEGIMEVCLGDWVICGLAGEFYPCKAAIFDVTYDRMNVKEEIT